MATLTDINTRTQKRQILHHLHTIGPITQQQALNLYGCGRLAARINDLKNMGINITTKTLNYTNRNGYTVRYAQYSVVKNDN